MKKEVGFFLAMMCVLALVGCGTSNNAGKTENNISQSAVEESIASEEIDVVSALGGAQKPVLYEEKLVESGGANNDLVYREHSSGYGLEEGYNIVIEKNKVIDGVDNVQSIVILLDNGVYKEFDFDDSDIEFTIERGGNYAFLAIDSNGNSVDIAPIVKVFKPADGGVIPLG